jgi:hypothetical protein
MRLGVLVLLAACGGGTAATKVEPTGTATMNLDENPKEKAPEDVDSHIHPPPMHVADLDKLYVEISSDGDHGDVLKKSAGSGLGAVPYAQLVEDGGDVELHVEVAALTPVPPDGTSCKVKIFVLRLPQHDLLAIADGGARASGDGMADSCLSAIGTNIVRQKLPPLLQRQLDAKK